MRKKNKLVTLYVCDKCGRFDVKPLTPHHFHPNVAKGSCGAPTVARTYVRAEDSTEKEKKAA